MIIAEIGQTYLLGWDTVVELVYQAKECGADLVKSQLFDGEKLYGDASRGLTFEQAKEMFRWGEEIGIEVFFSVFDVERVKWCKKIGVKRYKIAASQWNNHELHDALWEMGKPVIKSVDWRIISGNDPHLLSDCRLLYCDSHYPTPMEELEFGRYLVMYDGFSDHTIGLDASKIALARGAKIIEKHFALTHDIETGGVDAPWSMIPSELAELKRFENVCREVL
jgi:sialic acid synthase SpsE